jgi:hypothetical protein
MTERTCSTCQHSREDADGVEWCHSPQLGKYQGRSTRCIFERDVLTDRTPRSGDTRKCDPQGFNYQRRVTA